MDTGGYLFWRGFRFGLDWTRLLQIVKNCIFEEVTEDDDYVYFNLTNGTQIRIPKSSKFMDLLFY